MKRVLVTGGSGFVGRQTIPFLKERGFDVLTPSHTDLDVLDKNSITRAVRHLAPTHLLHFAWIATPGVYQTSPENERWKDASVHLFREAIKNGATRIVAAGSCFEYEWPDTPCIEDTTPINPSTLYGKCKDECRKELMKLAEDEGISAAWGRIFFMYGPSEPGKKLIASVIQSLLRGEAAEVTHCKQIRDFLYVKDTASAFASLLQSGINGAVNIAAGESVTLKQLVTSAARMIGAEDKVMFGAKEAPAGEPPVISADTTKLAGTGWKRRYSHEDGLRETIEWWRKHSSSGSL